MGHKTKKERSAVETLSPDDLPKGNKRSHYDSIEECNGDTPERIKECKTKKKKKSKKNRVEETDTTKDCIERERDVQSTEIRNDVSHVENGSSLEEKEISFKDKTVHKKKKKIKSKEISSDDVSSKKKKRTHDQCVEESKDSTHEVIKKRKTKKKKRKFENEMEDSSREVTERDSSIPSTHITDDVNVNEEDNDSLPDADSESEKKRKIKEKKRLKRLAKKEAEKTTRDQVTGEVGETKSLEYLRMWKHQRDQWSFQKVRQVWLLQHMYDINKVSDDNFEILLEYLAGLRGKATELTLQKAEKLVDDYGKTETDESITESGASEKQHDRARQVIQIIS